nr:RNA-directed DNA polymerase, eukaryota, reverse transcriptase zinc-binding domain protein [Tanacetum cinerariifolium]
MEELENFDSVIMGLSLQDELMVGRGLWILSGSFKVSILRSCIDSLDLSRSDPATLWNELITKNVNVLFWRFIRNRLRTKTKLVDKGIDLHTVLCSFWDDYCESSDHIFIECNMVKPIWDSLSRWCNVHVSLTRSHDLLVFTKTFDVVIRITSWVIWKHRNEKIFKKMIKSYSWARRWVLCNLIDKIQEHAAAADGIKVIDHFQHAMFSLLTCMCFGQKFDEGRINEIAKSSPSAWLRLSEPYYSAGEPKDMIRNLEFIEGHVADKQMNKIGHLYSSYRDDSWHGYMNGIGHICKTHSYLVSSATWSSPKHFSRKS